MAIKQVFISSLGNSKYIFTNGKEANFINGEYSTDIESEIADLENQIKAGHPHIGRNIAKLTVDTDSMDPIEDIKRRAIEEYVAKQKAASDIKNDRGTTEQSARLGGILTSRNVAAATAGSSSGAQ